MAIEYKALLDQDGVTVDTTAIFNSEAIPDGFEEWIPCPEEVVRGWTYDGNVFSPPPVIPPSPQELDALADQIAEDLVAQDAKFRTVGILLFQILRAQKTGDWTYFDSVTDAATFKQLVKQLIRDNL